MSDIGEMLTKAMEARLSAEDRLADAKMEFIRAVRYEHLTNQEFADKTAQDVSDNPAPREVTQAVEVEREAIAKWHVNQSREASGREKHTPYPGEVQHHHSTALAHTAAAQAIRSGEHVKP